MVPVSPTNRAKKASNKRLVSATTVWDLNLMVDDKVAAPGQDEVAQKLEVMMMMMMMMMMTDLSSQVKVTEDQ